MLARRMSDGRIEARQEAKAERTRRTANRPVGALDQLPVLPSLVTAGIILRTGPEHFRSGTRTD
jgi:hypothetical protein